MPSDFYLLKVREERNIQMEAEELSSPNRKATMVSWLFKGVLAYPLH